MNKLNKKNYKKVLFIVLIALVFVFTCSCKEVFINEIYSKSYDVGEIKITDLENLTEAAIEKTAEAVVGVSNYERGLLNTYQLSSTGSGVIYKRYIVLKDGTEILDNNENKSITSKIEDNAIKNYKYYVITNRHVVESVKSTNKISIYLGSINREVDATIVEYDTIVDLAVVYFEHQIYINPIEFIEDSDNIKRGNFAIAIGNPNGYEFYGSATFGIISFPKRYMTEDIDGDNIGDYDLEYIQHDVAINPGNSGGALINLEGKLIGINTLKLISEDTDNMGFAIPSNQVKKIVSILETGNRPVRYKLGVKVIEITDILRNIDIYPEQYENIEIPNEIDYGLYVDSIDGGGIAYGKLQPKDIILSINGEKIYMTQAIRIKLEEVSVGDSIVFTIYRNNKEISVTIVI